MHRPTLISTYTPLRGAVIAVLIVLFGTGPSWTQAAISNQGTLVKPAVPAFSSTLAPTGELSGPQGVKPIQPNGQVSGYEDPVWPDDSTLHWTDPEDPDLSLIATADLVDESETSQTWQGEAVDAVTGDVVVTLKATITYGDSGALWNVSFERFDNRFGFDPIPLSQSIELFEPSEDGDDGVAVPADITWLLIVLAANALALVLAGGGWTPNGCNKPCSNRWILCCIPHDACYCVGGNENNRKFCDIAFALCLAAAGMPAKSVKAYYRGVRLFGWLFFNYA